MTSTVFFSGSKASSMIRSCQIAQSNEKETWILRTLSLAIMSTPALPVELLHRILDHVDSGTVFLSFRNVCQYFHTVIDSYNQHKLDFRAITKSAFHRIPRSIQPENVVSLTLSNDHRTAGQITLFLSLFDIHAFTRLRSVTLIRIYNTDLTVFLEHVSKCPLVSLSIEKGNHEDTIERVQTLPLLISCQIRYLALTQWASFRDVTNTLIYFPCLETLLLDGLISTENVQQPVNLIPGLHKIEIISHSLSFPYSRYSDIVTIMHSISNTSQTDRSHNRVYICLEWRLVDGFH